MKSLNTNATEGVLSAVAACLDRSGAEALLRLQAPAALQARIEYLADRHTEGEITLDEKDEYESLVRVGNFVAILQSRARRQLAAGEAA